MASAPTLDHDLHETVIDLKERNEFLTVEVASLRKQCDDAISVTAGMESVCAQNRQFGSELRSLKTERDELSRRVKILLQSQADLRAQIDAARETRKPTVNFEPLPLPPASAPDSEITELKSKLAREQKRAQELSGSVGLLLTEAEVFFCAKIESLSQLRELFLRPKPPPPSPSLPDKLPNETNPELEAALHAATAKLKQERKKRTQSERGFTAQQAELQSVKQAADLLQGQIAELQEFAKQQKHTIHDQRLKIQSLEEKVVSLENLAFQPNQPPEVETQIVPDPAVVRENAALRSRNAALSSKLKELQETDFNLKEQLAALQNHNRGLEEQKDKLAEKLEKAKNLREEIDRECGTLREANAALLAQKEELASHCEATEPQMKAARASFEQAKSACDAAQFENKRLASGLKLLQSSFDAEKSQVRELIAQRERLLAVLHRYETVAKLFEQNLTSLKSETDKLREASKSARALPPPPVAQPVVEEIPQTSWLCVDFPKELCGLILELNHAMPVTARIKHILRTIARFYNEQIRELKQTVARDREENEAKNAAFDTFLGNLSVALNVAPMTVNSELFPIARLREENATLAARNRVLEERHARIQEVTGSRSDGEAEELFLALRDDNARLLSEISHLCASAKKFQKQSRHAAASLQAEIADRDARIGACNSELAKAADETAALAAAARRSQAEIAAAQERQRESEGAHQQAVASLEREKRELRGQIAQQRQAAASEAGAREAERLSLEEALDRARRKAAQWKRRAGAVLQERRERDARLAEQQRAHEGAMRDLQRRLADERAAAQAHAERAAEPLRQKARELSDLTQKTAEALLLADEKGRQLAAANAELAMERDRLLARLQGAADEHGRQLQLSQTRLRVVELAAETRAHNEIEDAREGCEQEKREIYAAVAAALQRWYDGRQQLDEREFREILARAQTDIARMLEQEARIRRLLALDVHEGPEEAIVELLRVRPFVADGARR
jgi:DNA repair exonuclease SbcCD ATPase subunit